MVESCKVFIVMPAYNEAKILGDVLRELLDCNPSYRVIVVDDGSCDGTATVAGSFGVHVLTHPVNLGQGAALATGIEYALREKAEIIVTFDADGQMCPQDISVLVSEVVNSGVDVALGSRFLTLPPVGMSRSKRIVLRLATAMTNLAISSPSVKCLLPYDIPNIPRPRDNPFLTPLTFYMSSLWEARNEPDKNYSHNSASAGFACVFNSKIAGSN